ncbi:MAG: hypothetical protein V1880_01760 [Patescibacteria group bacterium]
MINIIRKATIALSVVLIIFLGYQAFFNNTAKAWKNYSQPQLAAYTSLEQDEEILKELDRQTRYNTYKPLDPAYFVKPNIFQTIERN